LERVEHAETTNFSYMAKMEHRMSGLWYLGKGVVGPPCPLKKIKIAVTEEASFGWRVKAGLT
jgi:hypothetical protein